MHYPANLFCLDPSKCLMLVKSKEINESSQAVNAIDLKATVDIV
jgi:hypothetical protein